MKIIVTIIPINLVAKHAEIKNKNQIFNKLMVR